MKTFINPIILSTVLCLLFIPNLQAQQAIREGTFTISKSTYKISKLNTYKEYVIGNVDKSELKPDPEVVNGFPSEFIRTKMTNSKELDKVACEALGKDKREQLTAAQEKISGWIYYRADGTVINMVFAVKENTVLTLDDLARIERVLQKRFTATFESEPSNFHLHLNRITKNYEWDFSK